MKVLKKHWCVQLKILTEHQFIDAIVGQKYGRTLIAKVREFLVQRLGSDVSNIDHLKFSKVISECFEV